MIFTDERRVVLGSRSVLAGAALVGRAGCSSISPETRPWSSTEARRRTRGSTCAASTSRRG